MKECCQNCQFLKRENYIQDDKKLMAYKCKLKVSEIGYIDKEKLNNISCDYFISRWHY